MEISHIILTVIPYFHVKNKHVGKRFTYTRQIMWETSGIIQLQGAKDTCCILLQDRVAYFEALMQGPLD